MPNLRCFHGSILIVFACAGMAWAHSPAVAQDGKAAPQEFEVATIKPHPTGDRVISVGGEPGRFEAKNVTGKMLIERAFDLPEQQVSGGSAWVNSQHFDVAAKIADTQWQEISKLDYYHQQQLIRPMLQALLRERFQLELQHVPKELMIYALVVAKSGAKLRATGMPNVPMPSDSGDKYFLMAIDQKDVPVSMLADFLSQHFERTVLDQTGLSGRYDISLEVPVPADKSADEVDPAIFRALEDQLGLKLESRKAVVDTIVIERMEQPSPN